MPDPAAAPAAGPTPTTQGAAQQAAPTASPDPVLSAADAKSPTPAVETASPGGKASDPVADALEKVEPKWREDWREAIAGDDEKEMAHLRRFASFDNWARAQRELRVKLAAGAYKPTLPENATDADREVYRKSWGIPDKPEGYGIEFPKIEGHQPSDADKADLNMFLSVMHKSDATPQVVKAAADHYWAMQIASVKAARDIALEQTIDNLSTLKAEWGFDYERNTNLSKSYLSKYDKSNQVALLTLSDGTKLRDNPQFANFLVQAARENAGDGTMPDGQTSSGMSYEQEYQTLLELPYVNPSAARGKAYEDRKLYLSAKVEARKNKAA
jgi:hypothetical protein